MMTSRLPPESAAAKLAGDTLGGLRACTPSSEPQLGEGSHLRACRVHTRAHEGANGARERGEGRGQKQQPQEREESEVLRSQATQTQAVGDGSERAPSRCAMAEVELVQ